MALGVQLIAPLGLGTLERGTTYHYIHRDDDRERIVLAGFATTPARTWLEFVAIEVYEKAMQTGKLKVISASERKRMPPWLANYEHVHFDTDLVFHMKVPKKGQVQEDGVNARWAKIRHAIDDYKNIFSQYDPLKELNTHARKAETVQNESRFRLWVITYLSFGCNTWVLLPPTGGRGTYTRDDAEKLVKRMGRPSLDGIDHGYNVDANMKLKIKEGFQNFKNKKGKYLSDIHRNTLSKEFACKTRKGAQRGQEHCHPQGLAFPSYGQFHYWCYTLIGKEQVLRALLGEQEYRNKYAAPVGSYSESKQDLLEQVHYDASYSKEHPKSVLTGFALPKLCKVKLVDGTSAFIAGVAYGVGSERASLYKQALFCAGIPKSKYGQLLGIEINDEDWPAAILPTAVVHDQGAGGANEIRAISDSNDMSHDMSPAYTPQSNSPVENMNDKEPNVVGAPTHRVSSKSPLQMARDDVFKVIARNKSTSSLRRASPDHVSRGIITPHEIWVDFQTRGRIAGVIVGYEELVKQYLPKITLSVSGGFLTYKGSRYRSEALNATKFMTNIRKCEGATLNGHALDISTRVIWCYVDNQLIEVTAVNQIRASTDANNMTALEHAEYDRLKRVGGGELTRNRSAMKNWADEEFRRQTGKQPGAGTTKKGSAKVRSHETKKEVTAMRP